MVFQFVCLVFPLYRRLHIVLCVVLLCDVISSASPSGGARISAAELKALFEMFDADGGGDISTKELFKMMKFLGQNPIREELDTIIEEVDKDGSGTIDFEEFLVMMVKQMKEGAKEKSEEELAELFHVL
ncbi:troponin C, skeletal muscle-like, partial [Chiloscyllium plagiosum]|uniref:troponin C, skeletal muscle-like n=1 Tax=Chiloscyllium plagiosum TaxID=36176 RepID=UPI001CB7ECB9